nr:MAG TPA: Fruit-specific protein antiparallel, PLANT PROTEIN [Caudoviricetes sp.]
MAPLFNTDLTRVKSFLTFCNWCLTKLATRF